MPRGRPLKYDLRGQRYGRLLVLERAPNKGHKVMWTCRCDCGSIIDARSCSLISGLIRSCGCYQKERAREMMEIINNRRHWD